MYIYIICSVFCKYFIVVWRILRSLCCMQIAVIYQPIERSVIDCILSVFEHSYVLLNNSTLIENVHD